MKRLFCFRICLLAVIVPATLLSSCTNSSEDENTPTPAAATISITSPAEGTVFRTGDTIHIEGSIATAAQMHGYNICVKKISDNTMLHVKEEHFHGTSTHFHHSWVNTLADSADVVLEVTVNLDHDGNTAGKKRGIKCH